MPRRLIGTGITNSQGIAIMNKDSQGQTITGYTGTGAGKIQIIAESGELTSTTHTLTDCYFYDTCTTNHDQWLTATPDRLEVTNTNTGMTITGTSTSAYTLFANKKGTSTGLYDYDGEFCIEFDVTAIESSGSTVQIYDGVEDTSEHLYQFSLGSVTAGSHVKIEYKNNTVKVYVDDTVIRTTNNVRFTEPVRIGFRGYVEWSVTVKYFMIYAI